MWAVKIDGDVYATFETESEALGYVGVYLADGQGVVTVEAWEPQE